MEKLKLEVRNELEERRYALNLWEKVVLRWQNRDNELEELLQVKYSFEFLFIGYEYGYWCVMSS